THIHSRKDGNNKNQQILFSLPAEAHVVKVGMIVSDNNNNSNNKICDSSLLVCFTIILESISRHLHNKDHSNSVLSFYLDFLALIFSILFPHENCTSLNTDFIDGRV
ncbi:hypothetical protein SSS_05732, partial [Sarcoptes scabiei]